MSLLNGFAMCRSHKRTIVALWTLMLLLTAMQCVAITSAQLSHFWTLLLFTAMQCVAFTSAQFVATLVKFCSGYKYSEGADIVECQRTQKHKPLWAPPMCGLVYIHSSTCAACLTDMYAKREHVLSTSLAARASSKIM